MRKNTFYTAVLLLAAAVMAACSGGDDMTSDITPEQQTTTENDVVELVGTLSGKGGTTRAIDDMFNNSYWKVGDQFAIYYQTNSGHATATATVTDVNSYDGYSAKFRATLISPKRGDNAVKLVYPASAHDGKGGFKPDALMTQNGTLKYINDNSLDFESASTTMNVDGTNATLKSDVTMKPQVSLFILSLCRAGSGNPENRLLSTKKLEISNGTYKYTITPDKATQKFIIALLPSDIPTFTFSCQSSSEKDACVDYTYIKDFVPANITSSDIGNVILPDNKVYACSPGGLTYSGTFTATLEKGVWYYGDFYNGIFVELTPSSVSSPVAMIAYVGSETGEENNVSPLTAYNHGLAIAMKDANNGSNCSWGSNTGTLDNNYQWDGSEHAVSESGLQYRDARKTEAWPAFNACASYSVAGYDPADHGCSPWFLCSVYQWNQMLAACKDVKGLIFDERYWEYVELSGLRDVFSSHGGENIKDNSYWSCTERDAYGVSEYNFSTGSVEWGYSGWYYGDYNKNSSGGYVRSVFAF